MLSCDYCDLAASVPEKFIDELFEFYDESTLQTDLVVNLDYVSKWLNIKKCDLLRTLRLNYIDKIDYTTERVKNPYNKDARANNYIRCMLTPDCFKRLCMMSRAKNADMVRTYFIEIESLFIKHKDQLIKGLEDDISRLEKNQLPKKNYKKGEGYIYVIKASPYNDSLVKIGRTKDLKHRLINHMSSHADQFEVLYVYKAENIYAVEACVKGYLNGAKYQKYKEVFKVELEHVKRLIGRCDNVGKLEGVYQKKKGIKNKQEGGFYIALINS